MTRIAITGGPRTGKTTLAGDLEYSGLPAGLGTLQQPARWNVRHTDDLIHLGWSEASQAASLWFDEPGPWIVEGVAVSRALRKWRDQHPHMPPPIDRLIYLHEPLEALTTGQSAMAKGVAKVHAEIADWLVSHGIRTEHVSTAHQVPRLTDRPTP